jgi:hypothetical protein
LQANDAVQRAEEWGPDIIDEGVFITMRCLHHLALHVYVTIVLVARSETLIGTGTAEKGVKKRPFFHKVQGCPSKEQPSEPMVAPDNVTLTVEIENAHLILIVLNSGVIHSEGRSDGSHWWLKSRVDREFITPGQFKIEVYLFDSDDAATVQSMKRSDGSISVENWQRMQKMHSPDNAGVVASRDESILEQHVSRPRSVYECALWIDGPTAGEFSAESAKAYVAGNTADYDASRGGGRLPAAWLHVLREHGLRPGSTLLELGCGFLDLANVVVPFLAHRGYACVEPNRFLPLTALAERRPSEGPSLKDYVSDRQAIFSFRSDFLLDNEAGKPRRTFDFVFAHSVLSHFGTKQVEPFFAALKEQLAYPNGLGLFSLCLCGVCSEALPAENEVGILDLEQRGGCAASGEIEWVYPWVSFFQLSSLQAAAAEHGLEAHWTPATRYLLNSAMSAMDEGEVMGEVAVAAGGLERPSWRVKQTHIAVTHKKPREKGGYDGL